jgi:putative FmdB family regulatory protein
MPLYEYRCEACGHQFEVIQKFSDAPVDVCPSCGGSPVVKLLSSPAIQFKGEGWYITDYARKDQKAKDSGRADKESPKSDSGSKSSSSSDSAPSGSSSTSSGSSDKGSG